MAFFAPKSDKIKRLQASLKLFGWHKITCRREVYGNKRECNCGFDEAMKDAT